MLNYAMECFSSGGTGVAVKIKETVYSAQFLLSWLWPNTAQIQKKEKRNGLPLLKAQSKPRSKSYQKPVEWLGKATVNMEMFFSLEFW